MSRIDLETDPNDIYFTDGEPIINTYTTQRTAVARIQMYLSKLNLVMLWMEYKKVRIIEVSTSEGIMTFEYGEEFKLIPTI
jgi:hypothetical protein